MNPEYLKFPDGVHLKMDFSLTEEEGMRRKLNTSLGIPEDRYKHLKGEIVNLIKGELDNKSSRVVHLDRLTQRVAALCHTLDELVWAMYAFGTLLEQMKTARRRDNKRGGLPGGLAGMIIAMGSLPMGDGKPSSETGEEDSVEELIRKSKKINGDYNQRNYGESDNEDWE